MNIKRKLVSFVIILAMLVMSSVSVFASEDVDTGELTQSEQKELLLDEGFTEATLEALPEEEVEAISEAIADDPSNVDIQTTTMGIDQLAEIEEFMSLTDADLIANGANLENVEASREQIETMYELSNEELVAEYGISKAEAKLFDKAVEHGLSALDEGSNDVIDTAPDVETSGSIASSKLTFTLAVTTEKTATYPVRYIVKTAFSLKSPFALALFDDKIATYWGGGLNVVSESGSAVYQKTKSRRVGKEGIVYDVVSGSVTKKMASEETPNAVIMYTFPQSYNHGKVLSGYTSQVLRQTRIQKLEAKLIVQYGHKTVIITGGISITTSGVSAGVTFKLGWDTSPQVKKILNY
jgi:hypothetical protein